LSHEAAAPGAQRGTDCELLPTAGCACQQQIGHVHGGNDHHEDHQGKHDRSTQHIRSILILFRPGKTLRQNSDGHVRVRVWVLTREPLRHDTHRRLRPLDRGLGPEPRKCMKPASLSVVEVAGTRPIQRQVQLRFRERERTDKIWRHHTDDRARLTVHSHDLPYN
jgi:hypothetical protein